MTGWNPLPSSRAEFWSDMFRVMVERDERKARELLSLAWNVVAVSECDIATWPGAFLSGIENKIKNAS